ncbi:MAG: hypothetical protein QF437_02940 [Planctomycetota bacterium]|nr:hypothetical protein [Planctomycetota bacterium]
MLDQSLFSAYRKILRNLMNERADDLAMGGAKSFDEYQKMVGIIEGLATAEREMLDLMEKQRRAEDGSG